MAKINLSISEARKLFGNKVFSDNKPKRRCGQGLPDNHANRGMKLEKLINDANTFYQKEGVAVITKIPTEFIPIRRGGSVVSAKVAHKSVCDYIGVFEGIPVAIEAKSTKQKRISYDEVQPHQEKFLDDWVESGGRAFVLVAFNMERFFLVPWEYWGFCMNVWKNKDKWEYTEILFGNLKFHLNRMASICADEIPPEFEVYLDARTGRLDYIRGYLDYIRGYANTVIGFERCTAFLKKKEG